MTPVWPAILKALDRDGAAVLVAVKAVKGSAPREAGARMVVQRDGGFTGTIGGGTLEWEALAQARALLSGAADHAAMVMDLQLGPDLGQCCGGRAVLTLERFAKPDRAWIAPLAEAERRGFVRAALVGGSDDARRARRLLAAGETPPKGAEIETYGVDRLPVLLFGAGHVGRAVVLALAPLPVAVTWVDERADAFPDPLIGHVAARWMPEPVHALADIAPGTAVVIMTHSHARDLELTHAALTHPNAAFVGLIGSRTKRARFSRQLLELGLAPETIGRLACPVGVPGLAGKEPAVIAAGIAAQLMVERGRAAACPKLGLPARAAHAT